MAGVLSCVQKQRQHQHAKRVQLAFGVPVTPRCSYISPRCHTKHPYTHERKAGWRKIGPLEQRIQTRTFMRERGEQYTNKRYIFQPSERPKLLNRYRRYPAT